jgi:upstream activation factor subunit UAF30
MPKPNQIANKTAKPAAAKTETTTPVVAAAPTTVPETVAAPVQEAASKKTTKSAPAKVESASAETTPVVSEEVQAPAEGGAVEETLSGTELIIKRLQTQVSDLSAQIHSAQSSLKTLVTALKSLEKEHAKERKEFAKKAQKTKKSNRSRKPSGFAKSAPISPELADFLGLAHGSELARTEATSRINAYIKANNLQNPSNKKEILCDAKLKGLLQPAEGETVEYFNLQRFLKKHFLKTVVPTVSA